MNGEVPDGNLHWDNKYPSFNSNYNCSYLVANVSQDFHLLARNSECNNEAVKLHAFCEFVC